MVSTLRGACVMLLFYGLFWTTSASNNENCNGSFTLQPPTDLNCNPLNTIIELLCQVNTTNMNANLKWFRNTKGCQNESEITTEDDEYMINNSTAPLNTTISFNVTNDTTGYYWCAVTTDDGKRFNSSITRVYQYESRNNCPCSNELISQMHNNIPQCLDANTPLMCFPEPQFSPAAIIVPVIAAFITLLVLWILLLVHARYFGSLKNMTEPTTSQPLNRYYNKHALAEQEDTNIDNDCYVEKPMLETEKQTNLNELSEPKQPPSQPAYSKEPAEYLKPVKTSDTKTTELQDSAGGHKREEDMMAKSTDTTVHVHVYGNTKNI